MLWSALYAAFATTCMGEAARAELFMDAAVPGGVLYGMSNRGYSDVTASYRLRDARGRLVPWTAEVLGQEVRLTPTSPLQSGRYTLEQRALYDDRGDRVNWNFGAPEGAPAWFAIREVQVEPRSAEASTAPTNDDWHRIHGSDASYRRLFVTAVVAPGSRAELEVAGIGPIAGGFANRDGTIELGVSQGSCTHRPIALPLDGDVRVRIVTVLASGQRLPAPWRTVGPSVQYGSTLTPPPAPPTGEPAVVDRIPSWTALPAPLDPTPNHPVPTGGCGTLEPTGVPASVAMRFGMGWLVDGDQKLHRAGFQDDVLWLDDRSYEVPWRQLGLTGSTGAHVLDVKPDGVVFEDTQGRRWLQRFDATMNRDALEEVTQPLRIGRTTPIRVNGHAVAALAGQTLVAGSDTWADLAILPTRGPRGNLLTVVDEHGEVLWEEHFDQPLLEARVDDQGIHLHLQDAGKSFTHDGIPLPPTFPPAKPDSPVELGIGSDGRRVVRRGRRGFAVASGRAEPPLTPLPHPDAVFALQPGGVEVAWRSTRSGFRQSFRCTGRWLGIPEHLPEAPR